MKRVLLVEDDESIATLLGHAFKRTGRFLVLIVDSGCRAVAAARTFLPDLILLDLDLPGRNGTEVLADLRADRALEAIPVILMTGGVNSHDDTQSHLFGQCTIAKPFSTSQLLSCAAAMLLK